MEDIPNEKTTDELFLILQNIKNDSDELNELFGQMNAPEFHEYLSDLISERNISIEKLGIKALLSRSFTYQLCSGDRMPNRDIIIRIAIVLELSIDETQRLLQLANRGILYPKIKRDMLIIYALNNNYGLYKTDEFLSQFGQKPLL
ncbi:MAG: helix-turn-helix domain-containing protein [Oscillospiraceae bacterium]